MAPSARSPSNLARRFVAHTGLALVFALAAACANSDKPAQLEPDKPKNTTSEAKPADNEAAEIRALLDKAAEAGRAEEKAAAEKAAAEKAAAEKAAADKAAAEKAAEEARTKPAEAAKLGDNPKSVAASDPKKTTAATKPRASKGTKIDSKTGILVKGQADKFVKSGARAVVRLLEPGAEPRSAASYAMVQGAAKPLQLGMDLEMTMQAGELKVPTTAMPRMLLLFNFNTGEPKSAEWPIDGKLSKISLEPHGPIQEQIAGALRPHVGQLEGIGMNYFVDDKGRIRDVKVTLPDSLPAMAGQMMSGMTQSVESMTSSLPKEAIGIGAQWEVFSRIVANGADILQIITYTLEKREGDVLSLDAAVRQFAAKESVKPPGLPPGATARILSYECHGNGKPVFDLTDVAPKGGSLSIDSAMTIELEVENEGQREKQSTSVATKTTTYYTRPAS